MKYCSRCGAECLDKDVHCPKCGSYLKDPKTYNRMTFDKFMQTPEYMGCVALGISVISIGLCIGSAFVKTKPAAMSAIGLIVAIVGVFIASRCRNEMPEEFGMRSIATAAYALGIVSIVSCIVATACNGMYSVFGCLWDTSRAEYENACSCIKANLGVSDTDMGILFPFIKK